jgi:hypothetical protein
MMAVPMLDIFVRLVSVLLGLPTDAPTPEAERAVAGALVEVGGCTGFVVGTPGLAMTAAHCIEGPRIPIRVGALRRKASVLYADRSTDVAVVALPAELMALEPLTFAPDHLVPTRACRTGFPRGRLETICGAVVGPGTLATGQRRVLHLGAGGGGDSGSPLYDPRSGRVIGVHGHEIEGIADAADVKSARAALDEALEVARGARPLIEGQMPPLEPRAGEPEEIADALGVLREGAGQAAALWRLADRMWSRDRAWAEAAVRSLARYRELGRVPPSIGPASLALHGLLGKVRVTLFSGEAPAAMQERAELAAHIAGPQVDVLSEPAGRRTAWLALEGRTVSQAASKQGTGPSFQAQAAAPLDDRLLEDPLLVMAIVGERVLLHPSSKALAQAVAQASGNGEAAAPTGTIAPP